MRNEISVIQNFIQKEFIAKKRIPEYDLEKFRMMCISAGAPALFDTILSAITAPRHSAKRVNLNKKRAVYIIYKLCYCLSQQCNVLQVDHGLYFHSSHLSQEALDTQNILGNSCSRRTISNSLNTLAQQHSSKLEAFLHEAYTVPPRNNLALRLPASGPRPARVLRLLCPRLARKAPAFGPRLARVCVQATRGHPRLACSKLDAVSVVYSGKRTIS